MIHKHFAPLLFPIITLCLLLARPEVNAQSARSTNPQDWDKVLEAAKKEGKVQVSILASAELRKQLEEGFKKRFGIEVEVFTARGSSAVGAWRRNLRPE